MLCTHAGLCACRGCARVCLPRRHARRIVTGAHVVCDLTLAMSLLQMPVTVCIVQCAACRSRMAACDFARGHPMQRTKMQLRTVRIASCEHDE